MAETPHTPGPWHLSDDGRTVLSNWSHPVATLSDPTHRQVEVRGKVVTGNDGPLLAAAPELLEAARAVREGISALIPFSLDELPGAQEVRAELAMKLGMAHGLVLAAIAKAEGRAP